MKSENSKTAYFKSSIWVIISEFELTNFEGEIEYDDDFGPMISAKADLNIECPILRELFQEKKKYMESVKQEDISDEEVLNEIMKDLNSGHEIILNRLGPDIPEEGLYKEKNGTWRKVNNTVQYSDYKDLLWDLTDDMFSENLPTIPSMYEPFLQALSESDSHDIPPQGIVKDIISEHIESVRAERTSRKGVSRLKNELESRGIQPRTAASISKSMEKYLKTDNEIESIE